MAYSAARDEIFTGQPVASSVLVFKGGATGEEAPIRVIVGGKTRLHNPWGVGVDDTHGELYVADFTSRSISAFPIDADGNVAPLRVLQGPKTRITKPVGVTVDVAHDVIVVTTSPFLSAKGGRENGGIYIYKRTATGDMAPLRVIQGPKTGIISTWHSAVYKDLVFVSVSNVDWKPAYDYGGFECRKEVTKVPPWVWEHSPGFIGVWKITDSGDVPPRGVIKGPLAGLHDPGGIAIDPKDGEVFVGETAHNGIYTFLVPQLFE